MPRNHKEQRLLYCRWLRKQKDAVLRKFAYTDGTTFYLARGPAEATQKQRAALGPCVYRMANGKDGLWDENVGPSLYAKAQGLPVKIWGLFADGQLHYHVLPADGRKTTNMNIKRYNSLVKSKFAMWKRACFPRTRRPSLRLQHVVHRAIILFSWRGFGWKTLWKTLLARVWLEDVAE